MSEVKVYFRVQLPLRPDVPGAKMWAVGMERAMLTYFELAPNTKFPEHSHEAEQITMILDGKLTFTYEGREVTLKAEDVIAIPSNVVHSAFTGNSPCKAVDAWSPIRRELLGERRCMRIGMRGRSCPLIFLLSHILSTPLFSPTSPTILKDRER